jgi:hypothetical protein
VRQHVFADFAGASRRVPGLQRPDPTVAQGPIRNTWYAGDNKTVTFRIDADLGCVRAREPRRAAGTLLALGAAAASWGLTRHGAPGRRGSADLAILYSGKLSMSNFETNIIATNITWAGAGVHTHARAPGFVPLLTLRAAAPSLHRFSSWM